MKKIEKLFTFHVFSFYVISARELNHLLWACYVPLDSSTSVDSANCGVFLIEY